MKREVNSFTRFWERNVCGWNPNETMPSVPERNRAAVRFSVVLLVIAMLGIGGYSLLCTGCYSTSVQDFIIRANAAIAPNVPAQETPAP